MTTDYFRQSYQIECEAHVHEDELDEAADVRAEAGIRQAVEAEVEERFPLLKYSSSSIQFNSWREYAVTRLFEDDLSHRRVLGAEEDQ